MKYCGEKFYPYSEGPDHFIETFDGFTSRLHFSPSLDHYRFEPMPTEEVLDAFYNGVFVRSELTPTPETEFTPQVRTICLGVKQYLADVAGITGSDITLHDVGCGFGAGVWGFQQAGIKATGNEANRDWVNKANHFCDGQIFADELPEVLEKLKYKVDVFFIAHVLEHLPDPLDTLRLVSEYLSDRGVVYICVPNSLSERIARFGRRTGVDYGNFPMHLNFFSPRSLMTMLAEVGLEVVDLETRPMDDLPERANDANWPALARDSLHGGELFVLASKPVNKLVKRRPGLMQKLESAHDRFQQMRTELRRLD